MSNDSSKSKLPPPPVPHQFSSITWGPMRGLLVVVVAFAAGQLLAVMLVLVYLLLSHTPRFDVDTTPGQFAFVMLAEIFTVGLVWVLLRKKASLAQVGFSRRPQWNDAGRALLAGFVYFAAVIVVSSLAKALFSIDVDQKQEIGFQAVSGNKELIMTFISLVLMPPFVEEALFRGVLFGGFRKRLSFAWSALLVSALFAVPHLMEGKGSLLWIGGIDTFILSLVLCHLRERTGSLWAGIMLHMLKNGVAFLALYVFVVN